MKGPCSKYGEKRRSYQVLVGKREERRPLRGLRLRPEDNSETELTEIGRKGVEWINVAVILNMLMNLWVVQNTGNFLAT